MPASTRSIKRLSLLALLVPAIAVACGGSDGGSDASGDGLAEAATAPAAPPSAEPADPASSDAGAEPPSAEPQSAAPQGEEVGEQRSIGDSGGGDEAAATPTEPATDPGAPREEDTSRPVAPVLTGSTLDGEPISLEDFKGRPIIVKVFAAH